MRCDACRTHMVWDYEIRDDGSGHVHLCVKCAEVFDNPDICGFIRYENLCTLPAGHYGIHGGLT